MGDYDRDGDRERVRETDRTTVVTSDGGGRGGSGWIVAVLLLIVVLAVLFFLFGGGLNRAADEVGVNVNVEAPDISLPDKVELKVPEEVTVDTDGNSSN